MMIDRTQKRDRAQHKNRQCNGGTKKSEGKGNETKAEGQRGGAECRTAQTEQEAEAGFAGGLAAASREEIAPFFA